MAGPVSQRGVLRAGLDLRRDPGVAWLIEANAHPLQIKLRLGHKEIRTTMDTYGHLFPSAEPEMAGLLDAAYRGVEARPAVVSLES